ncbi:MAG: non-canonical purine NTP pyrophosphatase [Terriglobia bacterium]
MSPIKLLLASTNRGKLREFRQAALERHFIVEQVPQIDALPPCVEDGRTFDANARKKALHYAALVEGLIFADDSGISVEALDGAPGVYSARFSGPGATDDSNNEKLIFELRRKTAGSNAHGALRVPIDAAPFSGFPAHYVCVIVAAQGQRIRTVVEGRCDGVVIETPRGRGGFGYDPYFFYPPLGKTFAEITASEKFAVSHRGLAFRKFLATLGAAVRQRRADGCPPGT